VGWGCLVPYLGSSDCESNAESVLLNNGGFDAAERVLVVDDEPQVRAALARLLRSNGLEPVLAASAEEALALAQGQRLCAVITDLRMPGMGGISLLQRLSPLQPGVRFLVVTGNGPVDAHLLPRGHRVRVFPKPWSDADLVEAVLNGFSQGHSSVPPAMPSKRATQVLLVEDEPADALLLKTALRLSAEAQYDVCHVTSLAEARQALCRQTFDVACLDLSLPDAVGVDAVLQLQAEAPDLCLVVVSRLDDESVALSAVQAGAQDYLVKGRVSGATITKSLRYAQERKRAEQRLSELAFHDQLTTLANRTLFRQRVAQAVSRCRTTNGAFAVLLLDMDRFKAINDALGHDAGDAFLMQVASRLQAATRLTDTVARLGGDEFAVLVEPLPPQGSSLVARRILKDLRAPMDVNGAQLMPTASIGAALYPSSGSDCDSLLAAADAAMYVVKGRGGNSFHQHGVQLSRDLSERLELEQHLRHAIDQSQFELYYQPQVNLRGDWLGAEALLRWERPGHGKVEAAQFLAVLEETGLILELDRWALGTACRQLREWRDLGCQVPKLSVNLSSKQFTAGHLSTELRELMRRWQLLPSDLELELTESALLDQSEAVARQLAGLAHEGYHFALDNFGIGYGALACLRSSAIETVKIDRSIVRDMLHRTATRDLVGGLVSLVRRLGLQVIAEGVETESQRSALEEESCTLMQGYLFASPAPATDFIRSWQAHQGSSLSGPVSQAGSASLTGAASQTVAALQAEPAEARSRAAC
jgi:diguanylate cyclase (GGDEF)-like protein